MIATSELTRAELAGVASVLRGVGEPVAGELTAEVLTAGHSNLTVLLRDESSRWVLRTPPRVGRTPSAHDVVREHRVTAALRNTDVPVPRAVALCEDESIVGGPFAVAAFVPGTSLQSREDLERLTPSTRASMGTVLTATLAALHRVDPRKVGLGEFARWTGYATRQLTRWDAQWGVVGEPRLGGLAAEVADRLSDAVPPDGPTSVVHGDFRIDNTILQLDPRVEVAAIVDWELATLGDPVADVAMMCAYRHPALDAVLGQRAAWSSPDLPSGPELAATYEAAGGAPLHHFSFHLALAHYKIAVIAAGIAYRERMGTATGSGAEPAAVAAVEPYLTAALDHVRNHRDD